MMKTNTPTEDWLQEFDYPPARQKTEGQCWCRPIECVWCVARL